MYWSENFRMDLNSLFHDKREFTNLFEIINLIGGDDAIVAWDRDLPKLLTINPILTDQLPVKFVTTTTYGSLLYRYVKEHITWHTRIYFGYQSMISKCHPSWLSTHTWKRFD